MKLIRGADLTPEQKKIVLAAFIYRLTVENNYPRKNPCGATVPAISDCDWLKEHAFWFNNDGRHLSKTKHHAERDFT